MDDQNNNNPGDTAPSEPTTAPAAEPTAPMAEPVSPPAAAPVR